VGPGEFAQALRDQTAVAVTDTTFRDAHQSLLATRVRTRDLLAVAGPVARLTPQLWSVEAWGGATYDVALRFLAENPWDRLAALRQAMPNLCLQMLLRGPQHRGLHALPDRGHDAFVEEAARTGVDVFRVFDALNDVEQMRPAIEAVGETGTAVAEVALCYTGDLATRPRSCTPSTTTCARRADRRAGAHVLAIKDMAGLLRRPAARTLVTALRERFDLPVHLHTHDTAGRASWRRCSPPSTPGSTPSTSRTRPWPARRASRRCQHWSVLPTSPTGPPASTCARSVISSRTGRRCAASTRRSSLDPRADRPGL
jgi:pyruvate carboxylase